MILRTIEPGLSPELTGDPNRVDAGRLPPGLLVAGAMDGAVMRATEWDGELIADLAAKRAGLGESKVVGIRGLAAAHETRLLGDIAQVLPVAIAARGGNSEDALVDSLRSTRVGAVGGGNHLPPFNLRHRKFIVQGRSRIG
jgi:hypothetical protein